MSYLQNLQTHRSFCDGIHTPDEMVQYALEKNLDSLGFSSHSRAVYSSSSKVTLESTEAYKREIMEPKIRYASMISFAFFACRSASKFQTNIDQEKTDTKYHYCRQGRACNCRDQDPLLLCWYPTCGDKPA